MKQRARLFAWGSSIVAVAFVATACSSSGKGVSSNSTSAPDSPVTAGTSAPSGAPIKLAFPVDLTATATVGNWPEAVVGAKAAVKAINAAGGIKDPSGGPNRPLALEVCDTQGDANAAAACARTAVSEKALAVVGGETSEGAAYLPIVFQAGIPDVAGLMPSTPEETSPMAFPIDFGLENLYGQISAIKFGGKQTSITFVYNNPNIAALAPALKAYAGSIGLTINPDVQIPATATDFSSYAVKAASQPGGIAPIFNTADNVNFLHDLVAQGVNFHTRAIADVSASVTAAALAQLGSGVNGLWIVGEGWPVTYTTNAGVAQYVAETDAINKSTVKDEDGLNSWVGVHILATVLAKASSLTPTALVAALKAAGPIEQEPWGPVDFSHNAVQAGPAAALLGKLSDYVNTMMVDRVSSGVVTPAVSTFVTFDQPFQVIGG